jgi:hypothetical protein
MRGLAFIASDALASVSCLDSDNLVHVSSTWTGDIPPELSQLRYCWINPYLRLLDYIVYDAGKNFVSKEFK